VDRHDDGGEPAARLRSRPLAYRRERRTRRHARFEAGMHSRADRVGALERLLAVAGHVAHHDRRPAARELERVVEVAARGRSLARPVRDRRGERSELRRHLRKQGTLEQPDLVKKVLPVGLELARPAPLDEGPSAKCNRCQQQHPERQPHDPGDHLDELLDRSREPVASLVGGRGRRLGVAGGTVRVRPPGARAAARRDLAGPPCARTFALSVPAAGAAGSRFPATRAGAI